jgi:(+)-pinoresinol hydroxylase
VKHAGALVAAALLLTGVAAGADEPGLSPQQVRGKHLFAHTCIYCHSPGVWGTNRLGKRFDKEHALLENRTDLTAVQIQTVVRNGIGSMPALRKTELSDADVQAIAAYLTRQPR